MLKFIGLCLSESEIHDQTLLELDEVLQLNGRCLSDFPTMPYRTTSLQLPRQNKLLMAEMTYNIETLSRELDQLLQNIGLYMTQSLKQSLSQMRECTSYMSMEELAKLTSGKLYLHRCMQNVILF